MLGRPRYRLVQEWKRDIRADRGHKCGEVFALQIQKGCKSHKLLLAPLGNSLKAD
jgi:hypothetical protein